MKNKKIAIVYDWIDKWGGVERILLYLHELFPEAVFYTSFYDKKSAPWAQKLEIRTSFMQKLPNFIKKNRILSLPFFPYAFEQFDFSEFDLVISVTSSFAKGIITKPQTKHICYLLTPTRFLWVQPENYLKNIFLALGGSFLGRRLRLWDFIAAQHPDKIISISDKVASRTKKFYGRDSQVIYPPFDADYWANLASKKVELPEKFFLVVSRLEQYKKVDTVIEEFNKSAKNLVIVGKGALKDSLQRSAEENILFLQDLSDEELKYVYSRAECLIMPQEEDFGYVSLEAQANGCPVLTNGHSGAVETIFEGKTGLFYDAREPDDLAQAIEQAERASQKLKSSLFLVAKNHLEKFSKKRFTEQLINLSGFTTQHHTQTKQHLV
jgi:glycosyltransferase involved in cell wall biosynthesis